MSDPPEPPPEIETLNDVTAAGDHLNEGATPVIEEIADGDAAGAVADGIKPAGQAVADILRAAGVEGAAVDAVDEVASTIGTAVNDASEAARRGEYAASVGEGVTGAADSTRSILRGAGINEPLANAALQILSTSGEVAGSIERSVRSVRSMVAQHRRPHHPVELEFRSEADSAGTWLVRDFELRERIARPYLARITLVTEDMDAQPHLLLGQNATLMFRRGTDGRFVHGVVQRVIHGDRTDNHLVTTIELVPALEALRHNRRNRIFQGLTAQEVIPEVLNLSLADYQREASLESSARQPAQREYCVQFQESDFDFFHRLLEEEGMTYYFEQPPSWRGKERVVVHGDGAQQHPELRLEGGHAVFVHLEGNDASEAAPVFELRATESMGITSVKTVDFDWTRAGQMRVDAQVSEGGDEPAMLALLRDSFEQDSRIVHARYDKEKRKYLSNNVSDEADRRLVAHRVDRWQYRGLGAVVSFSPGHTFSLMGHPCHTLDREYLLLEVIHRGADPHYSEAASTDTDSSPSRHPHYQSEFVCMPANLAYRPNRNTPKPRVPGIQTAVVCGKSKEDIWTDEHGRIRVHFHWEDNYPGSETSTCWVRCVQQWAGDDHGALFIPRVGSEVAVTFIDGDPDRPVVLGCLYNGTNPHWNSLPKNKTKSGWKTRSSVNGAGYNELTFEDEDGHEEVYLRAERNLREYVKNDHQTRVLHDQYNKVDNDQTEDIGRDQKLWVLHDRTVQVDNNEIHRVGQNRHEHIRGNHLRLVDQNQVFETKGTRRVEVGERNMERYHKGRSIAVAEVDELEVVEGANRNVHVSGQYNMRADSHYHVENGTCQLHMENGRVHLAGMSDTARIDLDGRAETVLIQAPLGIKLQSGDSYIVITPNEIIIHAPQKVACKTSDESFVKVGASYVQAKSTSVGVEAEGVAAIKGSLVTLN